MTIELENGSAALRSEFFDKTLKGFANRMYKFKQVVNVVTTSAWINWFMREQNSVLTAKGQGISFGGIPRGASFPHSVQQYDEIKSVIKKFGAEQIIPWEDILTGNVDFSQRAMYKISEAVTKAVDDEIWNGLSEDRSPVNIATISMGNATNGGAWNETSAAIVDNLLRAKQLIAEANYDTSDLLLKNKFILNVTDFYF